MKQIKMFSGYNAEEVVADANKWLADQTKAAEPKKKKSPSTEKAKALLEDAAPSFEHSDPVMSVVSNQFVITIVYTAA